MKPVAKSLLVEGGGSHTWVMVADPQKLWAEEWLPSLNRIGGSAESQRSVLADVAQAAGRFTDIEDALFAVGAACTGAYLDELADIMTETLPASVRPAGRTYLTNDVVPLFFTEHDDCDQLVVIAGTGSGVAARRGFRAVSRTGSHEYLLGDDGGAFDIGRRALRAVIAHREARGPATALTARAQQRTAGAEIDWFVYGAANPKQAVAEFARDVFAADQVGDPVAGEILTQSAARLAEICRAALATVGLSAPITATFTGSLFTEPTGGLRRRIEEQLLRLGVSTYRSAAVDIDLLRRTSQALSSDQGIFDAIGATVPAIRL
jgi:N-acetylglucosamine kinase-like BadF-type ATPase